LRPNLVIRVLNPRIIIIQDFEGFIRGLYLPLLNEVILVTELTSDGGDVKSGQDPVIHIATDLIADDILRVTSMLVALRELSVL